MKIISIDTSTNPYNMFLSHKITKFQVFPIMNCFTLFKNQLRNIVKESLRSQTMITTDIVPKDVKPVSLAYAMYDSDPVVNKESPIFVLHGLFGSKMNWNTMSKNIAAITKRRVIAVDLRNHGDSPHTDEFSYNHLAADLLSLMKELEVANGQASLIGHSVGGRTVMALSLQYPSLVKDVTIVDISPIGQIPQPEYYESLVRALREVTLPHDIPLSKGRALADVRLSSYIKSKGLRNFILTNLVKSPQNKFTWRLNLDSLVKNMGNITEMPQFDSAFNKSTLFLCGDRSPYVKRSDHNAIYKLFPNAEFVYLEEAGHLVHAQKPKQFLKNVSDFLAGQSTK